MATKVLEAQEATLAAAGAIGRHVAEQTFLSDTLEARRHTPEHQATLNLGTARELQLQIAPGISQSFPVREVTSLLEARYDDTNSRTRVQYFTEVDFARLVSLEGRQLPPGQKAYYSDKEEVIRVCVPASGAGPLPEKYEMPLKDAQKMSAAMVHEIARANGSSEFEACYRTFASLNFHGLIGEMPSCAQIMDHVRANYSEDEVAAALQSFEKFDEDSYIEYMLNHNLEVHTTRAAGHNYKASYPHVPAAGAEDIKAPQNLTRLAWETRHPDAINEYQIQNQFESVDRQAEVYARILNRRHFEDGCPLVVPTEASYRPFQLKLETTTHRQEYLQAHLEWRGEMIPGKGWVRYEARYHTNTRPGVEGFPPSIVVGRRIGGDSEILLSPSDELRKVMSDPREAANFKTDASGNIWVSESRWSRARADRGANDIAILDRGHFPYYPCDQKGRIVR